MVTTRAEGFDGFQRAAAAKLGPRFVLDRAVLENVSEDRSGLAGVLPRAVVKAGSRDDVVAVAELADHFGVGIVPRGAGTGKVGGAIPGGNDVVLDLSAMCDVLHWAPDDHYAVVQPGITAGQLDREAAQHGLMYPPDPASWEKATLGGNIATNAGGPRALKYGVTGRYIWGVELVLAGGRVIRCGRRSLKGVTGLDITSLVVGSEGTLGIVTEATVHLIPRPAFVEGAWFELPDVLAAERLARRIFKTGAMPRCLELIDAEALDAVRDVHEVPGAAPVAVHLELDGATDAVGHEMHRLCEAVADVTVHRAGEEEERERYRRLRRAASEALRRRFPQKLSDDIAVPRSRMQTFLKQAHALARSRGVRIAAYGHLGDGNLHLNRLAATEEERRCAESLRAEFLQLTLALGGTLTAEHGIGLTKRDELWREQSPELIGLQRAVKRAFDPRGIMNPGKVLPDVSS